MPLRPPSMRSKSRSPIPPSDGGFSGRPARTFLPPSHYAAAAGLAYPVSGYGDTTHEGGDIEHSTRPHNMFRTTSNLGGDYTHYDYMASPQVAETPSVSHLSTSRSSRSNRQSRVGTIPLLETQLLPSLNDTISKMTRPPSRGNREIPASGAIPTSSHLPLPTSTGRPSSALDFNSNATNRSMAYDSGVSPAVNSTPKFLDTPKAGSDSHDSTNDRGTPKARPKSVLKSVLRSPAVPSATQDIPDAHFSPNPSSPTPRSIRSILAKKEQSQGFKKNGPTEKQFGFRGRSCTDPGAPPKPKMPAATSTATPQLPGKNNIRSFGTPVTSGLPRFQGRRKVNEKSLGYPSGQYSDRSIELAYGALEPSTDESDLEYRYELAAKDRRRLVVANADTLSVSSGSESEIEGRRSRVPVPSNRTGRPVDRTAGLNSRSPANRSGIGLGLALSNNPSMAKRSSSVPRPQLNERRVMQVSESEDDDDRSIYEDEEQHETSIQAGNVGQFEGKTEDSMDSFQAIHDRRREALLGIVSGLELQTHHYTDSSGTLHSESDYHGEPGVAISVSNEGDVYQCKTDQHDVTYRYDGTPQEIMSTTVSRDRDKALPSAKIKTTNARSNPSERLSTMTRASPALPQNAKVSQNGMDRSQSRSPVVKTVSTMPGLVPKRMSAYYVNGPTSLHDTVHAQPEEDWQRLINQDSHSLERSTDSDNDHHKPGHQADDDAHTPRSISADTCQEGALGPEQMLHSQSEGALSQADSDLSAIDNHHIWKDDDYNALSVGAEALFRKLSGSETTKVKSNGRRLHGEVSGIPPVRYSSKPIPREAKELSESRPSQFNPASVVSGKLAYSPSEASAYDDEILVDRRPQSQKPNAPQEHSESGSCQQPGLRSWQSDLPPEIYDILVKRHGEQEIQRQQIICEICETEKEYVARLHTILDLFILPLRIKDSKAWISGVPLDLAKLLDWFDDIVHLHVQLLDAIQRARTAQYPVVEKFADTIRSFVPRLEVYQPYLVRLGELAALIRRQIRDGSDLGDFIKMQETSPQCGGWTLDRLLEEPVNRLAKYSDYFQRLQDATQKTHPDYISTFTLRHSTDLMIRVMTEVKLREDEYELAKNVSRRIRGLPKDLELARRDRRLFMEGALRQLQPSECRAKNLSTQPSTYSSVTYDHLKHNHRLVDAIGEWDAGRRSRSGSTASSSTGVSFRSYSSSSSTLPTTPTSAYFPSGVGIASPFTPCSQSRFLKQLSSISTSKDNAKSPSELVHVFLFTDLALFTTPSSGERSEPSMTLMDDIGVSRIIEVSEVSSEVGHDTVLKLDVVPLKTSNSGIERLDSAVVKTLYLTLPEEQPNNQSWVSAFQKCQAFTLHALSIPPSFGAVKVPHKSDVSNAGVDSAIQGLLASGLPMPKSPSFQLTSSERGNAVSREREERGWWSVRFRQVFRELQNEDSAYYMQY